MLSYRIFTLLISSFIVFFYLLLSSYSIRFSARQAAKIRLAEPRLVFFLFWVFFLGIKIDAYRQLCGS